MKRFATTAMVFALVLAFAGLASAAELKVRGQVQAWGSANDNWDFVKTGTTRNSNFAYEDDFTIQERARLFFDFVANKDLKFVMQLQIGNGMWGQDGFGLGQGDARTNTSTSIRARQAYLDFNVPDTTVNVKAGYMTVTLPGNAGSGILDDEVGALLLSTPIIDKTLSVLVGYARLMDSTNANNTANAAGTGRNAYGMKDEFDAAVLALPVKLDGFEATPFFMYGWAGKDALADAYNGYASSSASSFSSGDTGRLLGLLSANPRAAQTAPVGFQKDISAWWAGFATKVTMFDPIWAAVDFNYGSLSGGKNVDNAASPWDNNNVNDRKGYLVDLIVGYNGLDMVKPKVWFAYSSGEDSDPTNGSERMPSLSAQLKYTPFWFAGDVASSTGTIGGVTANYDRSGFVAAGLTLEKITFLDKLTHDFYFAWIKGTNSKDLLTDPNMLAATSTRAGGFNTSGAMNALSYKPGQFLTTKDTLYELDLNTTYKVYEELSAIVEFGYIIQSLDKDTWNTYYGMTGAGDNSFKFSNAFKAMFGLSYDF